MSSAEAQARAVSRATPAARPRGPSRIVDDQRARLLEAIVDIVARDGYAGTKVGDISARAGVSRSTFYELFEDKQGCFLAAHRHLASLAGEQLQAAIAAAAPDQAVHAALAVIASLAEREPQALSFLTHEALLAGPSSRREYDRLTAGWQARVERRLPAARDGEGAFVLPLAILLGGAARLYCMQLRGDDAVCDGTRVALSAWVDCLRSSRPACVAGLPSPAPRRHFGAAQAPARWFPRALPRGRHRLAKELVDSIQRERIAHATTVAVMQHDGTDVAVADIVAAAGISREAFYAHFADKQQAFLAAQQLIFEQLIAAASSAFFLHDWPWPERVWNASAACAALLAANPSFAHFAFVASYAIGPAGARRCDAGLRAFGLFLEDGYRQAPAAGERSRLTSDAIALATMEAAAHHVRNGLTAQLPGLVPSIVYGALAPFVGVGAARELVERRVDAHGTA